MTDIEKKDIKQKWKNFLEVVVSFVILYAVVEYLHYLFKEVYFVEAYIVLFIFFATYGLIVFLRIKGYRKSVFIRHYTFTFFLGIVIYNYIMYPSYNNRYKITVKVETPQGLKTGSSVVEVKVTQWGSIYGLFAAHPGNDSRLIGEGIALKIDEKSTLLVLLENNERQGFFAENMLSYYRYTRVRNELPYYTFIKTHNHQETKIILTESGLPTMLSVVDGKSDDIVIDVVDPKNMEKSFRKEVKFKDLIIESTEDDVEWKIRGSDLDKRIINYIKNNKENKILPYRNKLLAIGFTD